MQKRVIIFVLMWIFYIWWNVYLGYRTHVVLCKSHLRMCLPWVEPVRYCWVILSGNISIPHTLYWRHSWNRAFQAENSCCVLEASISWYIFLSYKVFYVIASTNTLKCSLTWNYFFPSSFPCLCVFWDSVLEGLQSQSEILASMIDYRLVVISAFTSSVLVLDIKSR